MNQRHRTCARLAAGMALAALAGVLPGCRDRDVVARAGRTAVTRTELDAFVEGAAGPLAKDREAALRAVADRARAAEAARRAGLDEDRAVAARLAASRREILASAYLEKALEPSTREDALRARYAREKDRLTRRRIHVAHVVTRPAGPGKEAADAAQARIIRAYARLQGKASFEEVARELSEDEVSGRRGGDLGPVLEGQVDGAFFERAAALRAGELSRPFQSPYGFHVVKALEDPQAVTPTFEEVRGQLAAEARTEAERALMERLREDVATELFPDRAGIGPGAPRAGQAGEGR